MADADRIVMAGINHLGAPVACRERAAVPASALDATLDSLRETLGLREVAILSTCSRMEIAAVLPDDKSERCLVDWLGARVGDMGLASIYFHQGLEAVRHLFRVTSGLDSWIIGEYEIQAQVKTAYQAAQRRGCTGRMLNRMFQSAMAGGKSVRTRTGIQHGIHSVGGAAALVAKRIFKEVNGEVVVFGAGQAAEAVVRHLAAKDFSRIAVSNRTLERAQELARPLGAEALSLEQGLARLSTAEIAVCSLSVDAPWLTPAMLAPVIRARDRGLFIVDLGLPRNVAPECGKLDNIYLYDLDDLKGMVSKSMEGKASERLLAETLATDAAAACWRELNKPFGPEQEARLLQAAGKDRVLGGAS